MENTKYTTIKKDTSIEKLSVATVHMKNLLNDETQKWLLDWALELGKEGEEKGFYIKKDDKYQLNMGNRGRIYRELVDFPDYEKLKEICTELLKFGQKECSKLPDMTITHLLLVYYNTDEGMGWHRDSDKNDGDNDHPIVSISLGSTCTFGIKPIFKNEIFKEISNGDVLIWGGPERMLEHCVDQVKIGTSPFKNLKGRLNFTFRSAPNIIGKEKEFSTTSFWVDQ